MGTFWATYEELRKYFRVEDLELLDLKLDAACRWRQHDNTVLGYSSENEASPDLVFDIIVRNKGTVDSALLGIVAKLVECDFTPHGLPGDGLLFPQITYEVSIGGGRPGTYKARCEPPLVVRAGGVERFKIRVADTGYAWRGTLALGLDCGQGRVLPLPSMRIYT